MPREVCVEIPSFSRVGLTQFASRIHLGRSIQECRILDVGLLSAILRCGHPHGEWVSYSPKRRLPHPHPRPPPPLDRRLSNAHRCSAAATRPSFLAPLTTFPRTSRRARIYMDPSGRSPRSSSRSSYAPHSRPPSPRTSRIRTPPPPCSSTTSGCSPLRPRSCIRTASACPFCSGSRCGISASGSGVWSRRSHYGDMRTSCGSRSR